MTGREPYEPVLATSLPGEPHSFFILADPVGRAERALRFWEPVKIVLANGQRVIVRRKEVLT